MAKPEVSPRTRSTATTRAAAYKIAYDEGKDKLVGQTESLNEVRNQAGRVVTIVLGITVLAAGLVTPDANGPLKLHCWGVAAVTAASLGFLLAVVSVIGVWWPVDVTVSAYSDTLISDWADGNPPRDEAEMHRFLALRMGQWARSNEGGIKARYTWSVLSLVGLALETIGLLIVLVDIRL